MAYAPSDDRFYDALTGAGRDYQRYRDKVAEDQAATARELGQIYGQALPGTVNAVMKGADWSMKRAEDEQRMNLAQKADARAQNADVRADTTAGQQTTRFGWDSQDHDAAVAAAQKAAAYDASPATEEEAAMAGQSYQPGMTHGDIKTRASVQALGKDMRDLGFKQTEEQGRNTRSTAELSSAEKRAAAVLAGENARSAATIAGENARQDKSIAANKDLEGMKLAGSQAPKPAPAELVAKLGEADSAQKALTNLVGEWKQKASSSGSTLKQFIPNSDAARYDDAANINAQVIGKFLEEGRMTDADVPRYKAMLPSPSDTPDRAKEKAERMSNLIAAKKQAHVDALQAARYSVGNIPVAVGQTFPMDHLGQPRGTAEAAPDDANMNLAPADLQAAMVAKSNMPKAPKPLHQMTIEEKKAELRARGINVGD